MDEQLRAWTERERFTMDDLCAIVALLRDPADGCPWDKEQTHASIRKNFIEETYEVVDAIDLCDSALLCEELGDVLLQVALHTQMETECGAFTMEDVCTGICKKLIARHPHIFGESGARTPDEVLGAWERIKRREKHREGLAEDLESIPRALPALMRAQKAAKRAAQHGVSYTEAGAAEALSRYVDELAAAGRGDQRQREYWLGELLFHTAAAAQALGCDAEEALTRATGRFIELADDRQAD